MSLEEVQDLYQQTTAFRSARANRALRERRADSHDSESGQAHALYQGYELDKKNDGDDVVLRTA